MNIVFWVLVVFGGVALWFSLSSQFWNIGDAFTDLFQDAKDAIYTKDSEEDKGHE